MDELEISGKRYISTRLAGKEHKYHADYIGQLIRGGKVAGQKVGRSWYVDAESLAAYLDGEDAPRAPAPKVRTQPKQTQAFKEVVADAESPAEEVAEQVEEVAEAPEPAVQKEEPAEPVVIQEERISHRTLMPRPLQVARSAVTEVTEITEVAEEREEPVDEYYVPIKIAPAPARLRYIANERPVLPEISHKNTRHAARPAEEKVSEGVVIRPDLQPKRRARMHLLVPAAAVLVVGGIVLLAAAALSAGLTATTVVKKGQPASTVYSFNLHSASF